MSFHFNKTLSGLKSVTSDYIYNAYNLITNNLQVSGVFQTPQIADIENYLISVSGQIISLGSTINLLDEHQNAHQLSVSGTITAYGTTVSQLDINNNFTNRQVSVSFSDTRITTDFLQNEIDLINILAISSWERRY